MSEIPVQIVRFTDSSQPGWVECQFVDATGKLHVFEEKVPVVSIKGLWSDSQYPCDGGIACEVLSQWLDDTGRSLSRVSSAKPYGIESKEGGSEFVVRTELLRGIGSEANPAGHEEAHD